MKRYFVFFTLFAARLFFHPAYAQQSPVPFTSQTTTFDPAKIITVNASISGKKIIIDWTVSENQSANLFEVEKSTDGKNFTMAALVFGTDKPEKGIYQFYEKATNSLAISYRIKLVNKDKTAEYSTTVQVKTI